MPSFTIFDEVEHLWKRGYVVPNLCERPYDYTSESFDCLRNDQVLLTEDYLTTKGLNIVRIQEMELKNKNREMIHLEMIYPILNDEEVERKFSNAKKSLGEWKLNARNYQHILHVLLYKDEISIRDLFSKFCSWEVSFGMFTGSPLLSPGSIGEDEILGIFLLPDALSRKVCRSKSLWQFADKKIYISPVFSPSRTKKFYEAQALIKDSEVWVKIPKQCVVDARLSVGCFTRFEVMFQMKRSIYTVAHKHVDSLNMFYESATEMTFRGPGAQYLEIGWEQLGAAIAEGPEQFEKSFQELLCIYGAFY